MPNPFPRTILLGVGYDFNYAPTDYSDEKFTIQLSLSLKCAIRISTQKFLD